MNSVVMSEWLGPLDGLPLECDGMTRIISILLRREGIEHSVMIGSLSVDGVGNIPSPHFWIVLEDGVICDYRARMWLGEHESVPHGLFHPTDGQHYQGQINDQLNSGYNNDALLFSILAWQALDEYPRFSDETKSPNFA